MKENPDGSFLIDGPAEREAAERAEEQRTDRRYRKLQLWFNGVLMAATIVTAGTVLHQNDIFYKGLVEATKQSKAAMESAQVATDALALNKESAESATAQGELARQESRRALEMTIDTQRLGDRAWLAPSRFDLVQMETNKEWQSIAVITNTGRTAALDIEVYRFAWFEDKSLGTGEIEPLYQERFKRRAPRPLRLGSVFPGSTYSAVFTSEGVTANEIDVADIATGKKFVYLIGEIRYLDVYRVRHLTQFCVRWTPSLKAYLICPEHIRAN